MKVAICLPGKQFSGKFLNSLVNLIGGFHHDKISYCVVNSYTSSSAADVRQTILDILEKQFEPDYYLWIDSDQVFKYDDFKVLVDMNLDIVSGAYRTEWGVICAGSIVDNKTVFLSQEEAGEIPIEVDFVGFGFCLVKKIVIDSLEKPYFVDFYNEKKFYTDDIAFCEKARKKGFKVILNPTVKIGHEKLVIF